MKDSLRFFSILGSVWEDSFKMLSRFYEMLGGLFGILTGFFEDSWGILARFFEILGNILKKDPSTFLSDFLG